MKRVIHHVKKIKKHHFHLGVLATLIAIWGSMLMPHVNFADTVGTGDNQNNTTGTELTGYWTGGYLTGGYYTGGYLTGETRTGEYLTSHCYVDPYMTGGYYTGGYLTGGTLTGGYLTGGYYTGGYLTGQIRTGEYYSGEVLTGGYWTGGYITGKYLTGEYLTGEYLAGEYLTGQIRTGEYQEGGYWTDAGSCLTGGYYTGGYLTGETRTGEYLTGQTRVSLDQYDDSNQNSNNDYQSEDEENTCTTGSVEITKPISGDIVGGVMEVEWDIDGCLTGDKLKVELWDHNDQWIQIGIDNINDDDIYFDTTLLYSGMYHVTGDNQTGYIYTGAYTGQTTDWATGYALRVLNDSGVVVSTGEEFIFTIDNKSPIITGLDFTGVVEDGFDLMWITDEETKSWLAIYAAIDEYQTYSNSSYKTGHTYILSNLKDGYKYKFGIKVMDEAGNATNMTGSFQYTNTGVLELEFFETVDEEKNFAYNKRVLAKPSNMFKKEIKRYNECKEDIDVRELTMDVENFEVAMFMPKFDRSYVKAIVDAFTKFIIAEIGKKDLNQSSVNKITKDFNDFLVILKLVRDDNNECKQNLTNYHIRKFQRTLEQYKLFVD